MSLKEELTRAAALNHIRWFSDNALVAGGSVQSTGTATVIYSPASTPDAQGEVFLAFPEGDSFPNQGRAGAGA